MHLRKAWLVTGELYKFSIISDHTLENLTEGDLGPWCHQKGNQGTRSLWTYSPAVLDEMCPPFGGKKALCVEFSYSRRAYFQRFIQSNMILKSVTYTASLKFYLNYFAGFTTQHESQF